ncbi:UTP--glucose-1-phosphate uridylyltransferase [Sporolactobacillus sp. THM19-2]|uniref:UTP--glucose-1-phosphate uridylyltransferase n=1 Tax=Sporolactobacillus sp. THM19-2 TaxID=2511171 RepID=UPI0010218F6A|nr:UTP--glucose-1-phosphate uridylyltransferase [Sporolactobacillus sp. THM19-2]RYL94140.1 UTP--glucose-1-phosphate uridylyltransferase [Sporolactobacillus sp. THM19-2]
MVRKAIIPAAGYGTRSLPITRVIPKEMFPIHHKPSIQYVVEEAVSAGIEQILMIVSRSKNMIIDYFDESLELEMYLQRANKLHLLSKVKRPDVQILYTRQPFAGGLGQAIRLGQHFIGNDPFAVLLPDDLVIGEGIKELIDVYQEEHGSVIGLKEVEEEQLKNYGVIDGDPIRNDLFAIKGVVEKPQKNPPSSHAIIGRYVFTPEIMAALEKVQPDHGGEIQLTAGIQELLAAQPCYGKVISGQRFDVASEKEYIDLQRQMYRQHADHKGK